MKWTKHSKPLIQDCASSFLSKIVWIWRTDNWIYKSPTIFLWFPTDTWFNGVFLIINNLWKEKRRRKMRTVEKKFCDPLKVFNQKFDIQFSHGWRLTPFSKGGFEKKMPERCMYYIDTSLRLLKFFRQLKTVFMQEALFLKPNKE